MDFIHLNAEAFCIALGDEAAAFLISHHASLEWRREALTAISRAGNRRSHHNQPGA